MMVIRALHCSQKSQSSLLSLLLASSLFAVAVVISGCEEKRESWAEQPLEQDDVAAAVAPELGENTAEVMMSTAGDRRVEIEVTGGAADSLDWESLKQARFVGDAADRAVERIATEYEHAPSIQTLRINFAKKTEFGVGNAFLAKKYEYDRSDISTYLNP